ncbi:hypothetical protein BH11PLA2_BH11PLA2_15430 [soil metagenome]
MTIVTRLRLLTAVLGVSAATAVVATTVFGDSQTTKSARPAAAVIPNKSEAALDEFAKSKFATQPTLIYKGKDGPPVFAWQVKPSALVSTVRDRDIVVMVDTSASQAGEPLKRARQIITSLAQTASAGDRVDVWTVNLDNAEGTRSLTRGFKAVKSEAVQTAAAALTETEYASGSTDLKAGLDKALAAFERNPARQQVILFLGDGESSASKTPLDEAARVELGTKLDQADVAFFAVPLGLKINSHNLHGLASLTGGAVVRLTDDVNTENGRTNFGGKLKTSFDVPVLKPSKVTYGANVGETFPTRLPPLRTDRAMLVVGTLKGDAPSITAKVEGTVAGRPVTIDLTDAIPSSDNDNYFLHAMIEQWKTASVKDEPAILAADRALALASQQFRLFREDYLTQALYAVTSDKIDQAEKLYLTVLRIDPSSGEADAGLRVVSKIRKGEIKPGKLMGGSKEQARANLTKLSQDEPKPAGGGGAVPAPAPKTTVNATDALKQAQAERAVQEQQFRVLVDETVRRAKGLLTTDPDSAYEDLKRQRDVVLANSQLGDAYRMKLAADLEAAMQTISTKGAEIKRRAAEERERIARTTIRINEFQRQQAAEEATRSQIDAFRTLMSQARFELAQQEAQVMIQDRVARGQPVPPEAVASYMIGQAATNYREYRELVRIREDRYLLTMMQAEKSFIPYPDEPPVHFPPAAVWRELTSERARNAAGTLGGSMAPSQRRMQNVLDNQRLRLEQTLEGVSLDEFLKDITKATDGALPFVILEEEFKLNGIANVREIKLNLKQSLYGLTIGSALDIALQNVQLTYIVRPEYIEICSYDKRLKEKVVQTFDVGELVYDIPSSVNQAVLNQNQNVQNTNLQLFGQATFAGGLGGAAGGGAFGGGALGGGGFGGGGGGQGNQAQGAGVLGGNGIANNLGVGGGVAGISGGQIGQFGNLGGQFGIQGNSLQNYQLISNLVMQVVARGEWAALGSQFNVTAIPGQNNNIQNDPITTILPEDQLNSLAYYPPARAMIVRGTGKYHPASSIKLKKSDGAVQGGPGNPARNAVAGANPPAAPANGNPPAAVPAAGAAVPVNTLKHPKEHVGVKIDTREPNKMWQQAMDLTNVKDPGVVVAAADFLVEHKEFNHAAEVLKAGIRQGLTTEVWAQDALAMALNSGGGHSFASERAGMSAIDLDPNDAKAYIKAARTADDAGHTDIALAYCHRAADLDANMPLAYANALVYAEKSADVKADAIQWASTNLLQRDWMNDGVDYHAQTRTRLNKIVTKFEAAGRQDQVQNIRKSLDLEAQRDLVIELLWQGEADLDLFVNEPTGSTAGPTHKRTTGGGVLKADILEQSNDRSEIYTASQAFNGTYVISAKQVFKKAVGSKAQVRVTKFKGTPNENVEFFTIDFANPQPINFTMSGGTRTEMATIQDTEPAMLTLTENTAAKQGFGGGTGTTANGRSVTASRNIPTVMKSLEEKLPGFSPSAPAMRAEANVTADRKHVRVTMNPVLGSEVPMPKVSLLPGGGR